ncbi:hypothetical protein L228DRAFT_245737 [Xylona heveae TC161]|uniref:Uncharacterized protein n=1 Tax=Xylona heveae (strain CBS 132557 / TC161) TaxID=1328760 RepID=A0A165IDG0_XYLHT|nr:hypothetical protein L228DRAFT_245737 [Xylona heveae TC161]KZF24741.1 hypothetical protein L228DRAFT_245737 [Xylona heveae TC161]
MRFNFAALALTALATTANAAGYYNTTAPAGTGTALGTAVGTGTAVASTGGSFPTSTGSPEIDNAAPAGRGYSDRLTGSILALVVAAGVALTL